MAEKYRVRYLEEKETSKLFSTQEAAAEFCHKLEVKGKRFMMEPSDLIPMDKHDANSYWPPQHYKVMIEIDDTNHIMRTINFVMQNGLQAEFGKQLVQLLSLLCGTRGSKVDVEYPLSAPDNVQNIGYAKKE